jgi:hypothetical protein
MHSGILFRGKCGFPWKIMEESGIRISSFQNDIPTFENLFSKELKPIKTPMSEGYHPEIDDSPLCSEQYSDK